MLKIHGQVILKSKWDLKETKAGYVINGTIINNEKQYISFNAWDNVAEQISKLSLNSIIDIEAIFTKFERKTQKLLNENKQEKQDYWELGLTITKIKTSDFKMDENADYDWDKDTDELVKDINKTSAIANTQSKVEIILSDDESILWD